MMKVLVILDPLVFVIFCTKIVSKTITNRLKPFMNSIISCNESAFISGRFISDNIMVAHEMLLSMKRTKKEKVGKMVVKLDTSKAYNRAELEYIKAILKALGFKERWIHLVMSCITTVSYSVLVDGHPSEVFKPSTRLRQGDPFSPYLFLMCVEGLSSFINASEKKG